MEDIFNQIADATKPTNVSNTPRVWGRNKMGEILKEGHKIWCGHGSDQWFTHIQFDYENNKWHREQDYYNSSIIGNY
jgi:hypothetical protein